MRLCIFLVGIIYLYPCSNDTTTFNAERFLASLDLRTPKETFQRNKALIDIKNVMAVRVGYEYRVSKKWTGFGLVGLSLASLQKYQLEKINNPKVNYIQQHLKNSFSYEFGSSLMLPYNLKASCSFHFPSLSLEELPFTDVVNHLADKGMQDRIYDQAIPYDLLEEQYISTSFDRIELEFSLQKEFQFSQSIALFFQLGYGYTLSNQISLSSPSSLFNMVLKQAENNFRPELDSRLNTTRSYLRFSCGMSFSFGSFLTFN